MLRSALIMACGFLAGFPIGLLGPILLISAIKFWDHDERGVWSILTGSSVPYFLAVGVIAAANGTIGALNGLRSSSQKPWPVVPVPLLLLLYPLIEYIQYPNAGSKSWGSILMVVLCMMPFILIAGRIGQEIGVMGSRRQK